MPEISPNSNSVPDLDRYYMTTEQRAWPQIPMRAASLAGGKAPEGQMEDGAMASQHPGQIDRQPPTPCRYDGRRGRKSGVPYYFVQEDSKSAAVWYGLTRAVKACQGPTGSTPKSQEDAIPALSPEGEISAPLLYSANAGADSTVIYYYSDIPNDATKETMAGTVPWVGREILRIAVGNGTITPEEAFILKLRLDPERRKYSLREVAATYGRAFRAGVSPQTIRQRQALAQIKLSMDPEVEAFFEELL